MTTATKENKNSVKNSVPGEKPEQVRNTSGLVPFKPGESGNPAGRPKGRLDFNTRVDMAIEVLALAFIAQHNKLKKNAKKQMTLADIDIEGDIFRQFINKARGGDLKAIDSFLDRRFGKAVQPTKELTPDDPIYDAQTALAVKEIEEWEKGWEAIGVKSGNKKHGTDNTHKGTKKETAAK